VVYAHIRFVLQDYTVNSGGEVQLFQRKFLPQSSGQMSNVSGRVRVQSEHSLHLADMQSRAGTSPCKIRFFLPDSALSHTCSVPSCSFAVLLIVSFQLYCLTTLLALYLASYSITFYSY
jgi:hypothetical protein